MSIPQAKLPHLPLPVIRGVPSIPGVGRPGSAPALLIGTQFGNLPDLQAVLGIKALKKAMDEQIYALIQGQLPFATRPPIYAARAALLADYVISILDTLNAVIGGFIAETTAAITFVTGKLAELNQVRDGILARPAHARSKVQQLLLSRYGEYIAEGNAQLSRLNTALSSIIG